MIDTRDLKANIAPIFIITESNLFVSSTGSKEKMVRTIQCHHRTLKNSLTLTRLTHNEKS